MVTLLDSFRSRDSGSGRRSTLKLVLDGDGNAGELVDRMRGDMPRGRPCGAGNSENDGDFMCGEVARLVRPFSLAISSLTILSLIVLSFSSVACLLARSEDMVLLPSGFKTPLNMMLYLSSRISGISTSKKLELPRLGGEDSAG